MQLSTNFTLSEFTKSQTALRKNIDNRPDKESICNMKLLCDNILQPLRDKFGPIKITSGYRSTELCLAIGSSITSQHAKGQAADFEMFYGIPNNYELATYIKNNLNFDQLILEFYTSGIPTSGWIHCSYKSSDTNRKQILTSTKENGKTVYVSGLIR